MSEIELNNVVQLQCATRNPYTKSSVEKLIATICREVNHHNLTYEQLKRVFRVVRHRCSIEVPTKKQTLIELPTAQQLKIFFDAIESPVHKLIFETLLGTGLRISELCNLEVKRIDFDRNQAFVHQGKNSKDRIVVFGHKLKSKLLLYLASNPKNRFLFESERRTKFSTRRVQQLIELYSKKSKIKMHCHLLRHITITHWAELGMTEDQRAILSGHSDVSTQREYTHLSLSGIKDQAIEALDKLEI